MPQKLLSAYLQMLPVIAARDDLRAASVALYGSGSMKRSDARQYMRDLRRSASSVKRARRNAVTDLPPEQMTARLQMLGIEVNLVPVKELEE